MSEGELELEVELEAKPVAASGELAQSSGACDLQGVLAAEGSGALARRACERDLAIERELAHGLRISTASALNNEARERHLAGWVEGARQGYDQALREDADGREPSAVSALARVNLALLLHEQGDHAAAEQHLQWVLEHASHPALRGAAYHNLSLVRLAQDDLDGALAASQRGLRALRASQGRAHGSVGAALNALGTIRAERGELEEAIVALEAAVEIRTSALGRLHPDTAASLTNLGIALGRAGRWEEALARQLEALEIDQEVLGPRHAATAVDLAQIGEALMALHRTRAARARFAAALEILEPQRPIDDPELLELRRWLALCNAGPS
ncbi:MAG: tetratricopeptide repeat protein [Myxococcales bacterium]|nr:tetratricopeptide repeat protein [Myxococcales bacterium]MCB9717815.1 tetratricopeptide repeat protein [Myxococcales bacterium]